MKLTMLLAIICTLGLSAASSYSQETKLTLTLDNVKIKDVLKEIKKKSDFSFWYSNVELNDDKRVTLDVKNVTVDKILELALKDENLTYEIKDKFILIYKPIIKNSNGEMSGIKQQKLTGTVLDATTGEPIIGANIVVEGTTIGVISDANGKYSLDISKSDAVLVVSFLGYNSERVSVNGQSVLEIKLVPDLISLEEVVVVGYGSQKKVNLVGSVSSITNKVLKTATTANVVDNMAGKLPGLRVVQRTSEPGAYNSTFDIRGWGSPLIVIDGIPRDNVGKLDPNEIESITVLKDASAAVYGVKAANGVILVTTKKGEAGKPKFEYSGTYGIQQVTKFPRPMNAAEFAEAYDWAQQNSGLTPTYSPQQIADYKSGKLPSTNWWDVAMNNTAPQQQHNLSISGGNEKIRYFSSLGYAKQDGLLKSGDYWSEKYNIRLKLDAELTKSLSVSLNIGGIADKTNSPSTWIGGIFKGIWMQIPTMPLYANNDPNYLQNLPDGNNPYSVTHSSILGDQSNTNKSLTTDITLKYKIPYVNGLVAKMVAGYDLNHSYNKAFHKLYNLYDYDVASKTYKVSPNNSPSNMDESFSEGVRFTTQMSLEYDKVFGNHSISGKLIYETRKITNDNFNGNRQFTVDAVQQLYAGNATQRISANANNVNEFHNQGIIGIIDYNFASKYLVELSFRNDGSSNFPPGKRWGFFPGALIGWRISEENFIKNNFDFIKNLKIRGSWAQMGDDQSGQFQFVPGYTYPTSQTFNGYPLGYMFNGAPTTGLGFIGMINPAITWYTSVNSNFGIDANLWNDKINFQFDVFNRNRSGLLDTRLLSLPKSVGASLPQENLNGDQTRGFEVVLGTTQHINDIVWSVSGHFDYTHTKWLHKEEAKAGNAYLNWRNSNSNRSNNIIWGDNLDGQFQTQGEINNAPIEDGNGNRYVKPGDLKYTDINQDGVIDDWDVVPIAKGNTGDNQGSPEINYGITLTFAWKNIDMTALFQGATNFSVQLNEQLTGPFPWGRNGLSQFYDAWHQADVSDPNSAWIAGNYPAARLSGVNPNGNQSPYFIKDASYLRFKNFEIGYTIPGNFLKKIGIQKFRIYSNGLNLITWSKIPYMDPEHPQGQYGYMYPINRTFNFGLNLTF